MSDEMELREVDLEVQTWPLRHVEGTRLMLLHIPSGIAVIEETDGSLIKCRVKALLRLKALLAAHAQIERMRGVVEASVNLRLAESTGTPGESIAELEANVPAAVKRTSLAILRWRESVDVYRTTAQPAARVG